ncbi:uncharacterized protein LOC123320637 [Coccinella septempunctata]|uniref:uncharacterized protein LOC123320637 n=1 Tax=Coccinella septempunctata TaxID=41139 RepID=UPI001D065C63|nr:uncharacterized protein LOC123320637 [Coccinella septempunctata]
MYKNIVVLFLAVTAASQIEASCFRGCGIGSGVDVCSDNCQPLVVRPQDLPKPPQATISVPGPPIKVPLPTIPLGGPCFCRKPTVKPAVIPKPVCNTCRRRVCNTCNSCQSQRNQRIEEEVVENLGCGGNSFGDFGSYGPVNPGLPGVPGGFAPYPVPLPETREQLAPADPVSVSIAYNLAKRAQNLKEDILSFGFRQMPKEVPVQQRQRNVIPEENLYSLNGAVVELKPVTTLGKSVDEEAAEQLMDLQEEETVGESGVRKLTLGEVGYGLAKVQQPTATYVNVPPTPLTVPACKDPGYIPGKVIIDQIPKLEPVLIPPGPPEPCAPECPCRYTNKGEFGSFGSFSSKVSSSSSSRSQSGILIHKLFD